MATSTFYDNIVLGKEAGERLAQLLREPPLPRPEVDFEFIEMGDERLKQALLNLRISAQAQTEK